MNDVYTTGQRHAAGKRERLYTVTGGRTRPSISMGMLTLLTAAHNAASNRLRVDHAQVLALCRPQASSVAEIAARMHTPMAVIRVVIADLVETEHLIMHDPTPVADAADVETLEKVLQGLKRL